MITYVCEECTSSTPCFHAADGDKAPIKCPYIISPAGDGSEWKETTQYEIKKREPEHPKLYRLEIPEMIRKEDIWKATELQDGRLDGDIIYSTFNRHKFSFSDIPKDWLIHIEPEEMTAEEWVNNKPPYLMHDNNCTVVPVWSKMDMIDAINEGIRREQRKHKPQQMFRQWFDESGFDDMVVKDALFTWNACRKSLGYEPE